ELDHEPRIATESGSIRDFEGRPRRLYPRPRRRPRRNGRHRQCSSARLHSYRVLAGEQQRVPRLHPRLDAGTPLGHAGRHGGRCAAARLRRRWVHQRHCALRRRRLSRRDEVATLARRMNLMNQTQVTLEPSRAMAQGAGTAESSLAPIVTADVAPRAVAIGAPVSRAGIVRRALRTRSFSAVISFAVFLLLWDVIAEWLDAPIQFPSPLRVASAFVDLASGGELFEHALISTTRLAISLAVALALAVPVGFFMGLNE